MLNFHFSNCLKSFSFEIFALLQKNVRQTSGLIYFKPFTFVLLQTSPRCVLHFLKYYDN